MNDPFKPMTATEAATLSAGDTTEKMQLILYKALNLLTGEARAIGLDPTDVLVVMRTVVKVMEQLPGVKFCDCENCEAEIETEATLLASCVQVVGSANEALLAALGRARTPGAQIKRTATKPGGEL
jgi:hypothetical protein